MTAIKTVEIAGNFRKCTSIGTWQAATFTVSPIPGETVRQAWYRQHGDEWDVNIMQCCEPSISLESVLLEVTA